MPFSQEAVFEFLKSYWCEGLKCVYTSDEICSTLQCSLRGCGWVVLSQNWDHEGQDPLREIMWNTWGPGGAQSAFIQSLLFKVNLEMWGPTAINTVPVMTFALWTEFHIIMGRSLHRRKWHNNIWRQSFVFTAYLNLWTPLANIYIIIFNIILMFILSHF